MLGNKKPIGKNSPRSKKVCQITKDGNLIKIWDCIFDVERELKVSSSHISQVCKNKRKLAGGFIWVYEEEYDSNKEYNQIPHIKDMGKGTKPVVLLSDNNEIIREFYSVNNAGEALGIKGQEVSRICSHKAKTIKFNLKYKSEYLEEQRLSEKGFYVEVA